MGAPSLGWVQLKWKGLVVCMITGCTAHTHTHTHTHTDTHTSNGCTVTWICNELCIEIREMEFYIVLSSLSSFFSLLRPPPPIPSPLLPPFQCSEIFNISEWSAPVLFYSESDSFACTQTLYIKNNNVLVGYLIVCSTQWHISLIRVGAGGGGWRSQKQYVVG